jgi:DNA-binding transcriptional ArsR family regulator
MAMNLHLAETAALVSDPGRASMLLALLGGISLPAGRLAMIANIAPQTASSHLSRLVSGRLLFVEAQGRHRYYRLANDEVAHAIEALLAVTPQCDRQIRSVRLPAGADQNIVFARTCYSHLAGRLGVELVEALERKGLLVPHDSQRFGITQAGRAWFLNFGLTLTESQWTHPRLARRCLDWTERKHHLAGYLGCSLLTRFRELKWIAPLRGTRAVRVTIAGQDGFQKLLGLRLPQNLQA